MFLIAAPGPSRATYTVKYPLYFETSISCDGNAEIDRQYLPHRALLVLLVRRRPQYPLDRTYIGGIPFGFGIIFLQCLNYLIYAYLNFAASAIAAITILWSAFAAGFPLLGGSCSSLSPRALLVWAGREFVGAFGSGYGAYSGGFLPQGSSNQKEEQMGALVHSLITVRHTCGFHIVMPGVPRAVQWFLVRILGRVFWAFLVFMKDRLDHTIQSFYRNRYRPVSSIN
jgi:hypothetical protein